MRMLAANRQARRETTVTFGVLLGACLIAALAAPVVTSGAGAGEPDSDARVWVLYTMDARGFLMTCG